MKQLVFVEIERSGQLQVEMLARPGEVAFEGQLQCEGRPNPKEFFASCKQHPYGAARIRAGEGRVFPGRVKARLALGHFAS